MDSKSSSRRHAAQSLSPALYRLTNGGNIDTRRAGVCPGKKTSSASSICWSRRELFPALIRKHSLDKYAETLRISL